MKKRSYHTARFAAACLIMSLMLSLCGCGHSAGVKADDLTKNIDPASVQGKAVDTAFTDSQYRFTAELLKNTEKGENCLISPLSAVLALAMTANGAAEETLSQMLEVIGGGMPLSDLNAYLYEYVNGLLAGDGKSKLSIANSLWINEQGDLAVGEEFLRDIVSWYRAPVYKLPFDEKAVAEVNGWVSANTDKMIRKIVETLNANDRMLLINAICFDGKWTEAFKESRKAPFTAADGSKKEIEMMFSREQSYYEGEDYTGFAKKYGNDCRFIAILPDKNIRLSDFIAGLDGEKLSAVINSARTTTVDIGLPEFTGEYEMNLVQGLKNMGMTDAFRDEADFSRMSSERSLYVSGVVQKTFIDVNKNGTRAAAVTGVTMAVKAIAEPEIKSVILDRPFLYMIVDNENDLPIFIGTVESVD